MRRSRFSNPWPTQPPSGHNNVLRWALAHRLRRAPDPRDCGIEIATPAFDRPTASANELTVTWIGHSTVLVQIGGLNVLTDPVWADRASPLPFAGPRRRLPAAIPLADLPHVDAVVVSHNHYDHLDVTTVRQLAALGPDTAWLVPLGVGDLIRGAGARHVSELDWWGDQTIGPVSFTCVPAQHSSGRGIADRNRSLWCGWTMRTGTIVAQSVYFAGDTAYFPGFVEIGARLGPFDVCLLPIGAYEPRWYMRYVHMTPEEAVRAYEELCRGSVERSSFVPIHWGTFRIADEALDEPPGRLKAEWAAAHFPSRALSFLAHGETRRWPHASTKLAG